MSLLKPKAIMNLSCIPGSAEILAAVRNICEAEKGLWRVIDAPFGLPGFIDNGTYFIGRERGEIHRRQTLDRTGWQGNANAQAALGSAYYLATK